MPFYSYREMIDGEFFGEVVEEFITLGDQLSQPPQKIKRGGKTLHRDVISDHCRTPVRGDKEYVSEALACHPSEVGEKLAEAKKLGVSLKRINPDGTIVFSSARQKEQYAKAYGCYQKNSFGL